MTSSVIFVMCAEDGKVAMLCLNPSWKTPYHWCQNLLRGRLKRNPNSLKKRWKRKLMDSKVKNEKNLECALSFVEGSETLDNIVLTADVRQTACYIHL